MHHKRRSLLHLPLLQRQQLRSAKRSRTAMRRRASRRGGVERLFCRRRHSLLHLPLLQRHRGWKKKLRWSRLAKQSLRVIATTTMGQQRRKKQSRRRRGIVTITIMTLADVMGQQRRKKQSRSRRGIDTIIIIITTTTTAPLLLLFSPPSPPRRVQSPGAARFREP